MSSRARGLRCAVRPRRVVDGMRTENFNLGDNLFTE